MQIFEDRFSGNASAMERLLDAMQNDGVTGFTGAGTSMPAMPSWQRLVNDLISDAHHDGRIDEGVASALHGEKTDILFVIDEIYNAVGAGQTKAKVARLFQSLQQPTLSHTLLSAIDFKRVMTLNYDNGLEMAYATHRAMYVSSITARQSNEVDEWLRRNLETAHTPVLHWHGVASDASSIVLSGSDYVNFYDQVSSNRAVLRGIFGTSSILLVGFGFTDPFITRELNAIMQPLNAANSHYAIIGVDDDSSFNLQLERRRYASKYKLEPLFYPVSLQKGFPDHSALTEILSYIADRHPRSEQKKNPADRQGSAITVVSEATVSYRSTLFSIGDKQIYCDPNIWRLESTGPQNVEASVIISEIIQDNSHCSIISQHEYGLSNFGQRLASELKISGIAVVMREANSLPKYRKGLQSDHDFSGMKKDHHFVVIMDNFIVADHQRTLREFVALFPEARVVVLQKSGSNSSFDDLLSTMGFKSFELRGFTRTNIRTVINIIAPSYNTDDTSIIVDKVYNDLIQLCIPLTPSNVIMYSSVLCKDGSFSPVSRLHIVDKFISEALRRASDAYADTFNSNNKIDLVASFCYVLFEKNETTFTHSEWKAFCDRYKSTKLVEFDASDIIADLHNGRIVTREGETYIFRYRMFYSYFVGRHISDSQELLQRCISENRHLEIDGLIEVLCGTLPDSSIILNDLTTKAKSAFANFYNDYPINGLDFHLGVRWEKKKNEQALWDSVADRLDKGPASTQELDELKTSVYAERRTVDQKVSIIKFIASEHTITRHTAYLIKALESTKNASASSKLAATTAIVDGTILTYEVASIFVPLIAERKYVSWSGFVYINLIEDHANESDNLDLAAEKERKQNLVVYSLPGSIALNAADVYGIRKHGQVFLSLLEERENLSEMKKLLLFSLTLRSKPTGWQKSTKEVVAETDRHNLYLRHMLELGMRQFRNEINSEKERKDIKGLIAAVQLRRDVNVKSASPSQVRQAVEKLEEGGFWDKVEKSGKSG